MASNQTKGSIGFNKGLLSSFWWLKSANHLKFTGECVMCMEKHDLVKKMFTNGLNMSLSLQTQVEIH